MSSCSMPIIVDGKYIGCVTVDMELSTVTGVIDSIKVGENGDAMLLDSAGSLADGDFSINPIEVKREDELGVMSSSLNNMYESNREVLSGIARYAVEIDDSDKRLNKASEELTSQFENIQRLMANVNEDMMTTSAATEQVNASYEEVLANVSLLTGETDESMEMSREIKERDSIDEASEHVESVFSMSTTQQEIADTLTDTVGKFKLD